MKAFLEYIPLLFFLVIFKLQERVISIAGFAVTIGGIESATKALMLSTVLVFGVLLIKDKRLTNLQWLVVVAVMIFGSLTLLLHSVTILKWKAPVVNWIIALVFVGSQYFRPENMAKTMFGKLVTMPDTRWKTLNLAWAGVFFIVGTANLFVAFTFPDYWVDFKVFGSFGLLLLASIAQIAYIYPYMNAESADDKEKSGVNLPK